MCLEYRNGLGTGLIAGYLAALMVLTMVVI
jgi:hypothetical protein